MSEPLGELPAESRPRLGRPPRISRQMIAEAAHELGLEGLTLKAVARRLDVSIAGLYHHVRGKDDLMRLAAEYSASTVPLPQDHGQHWAVWLLEWAEYNLDAFTADPVLIGQYLDGAISVESIAANVDLILGVLVREGFTVGEANAAYELVSTAAVGAAVGALRERGLAEGSTIRQAYQQVLAHRGEDELPHLRRLLHDVVAHGRPSFEEQITTVLVGIAVRRGEDWRPIARRVRRARSLR